LGEREYRLVIDGGVVVGEKIAETDDHACV